MPTLTKQSKKPKERNTADRSIYNSTQWKNLRASYFMEHPLCEMCLKEDKVTPAIDIHHIIPFLRGKTPLEQRDLAFNYNNLMALCKEHHQKIHQTL